MLVKRLQRLTHTSVYPFGSVTLLRTGWLLLMSTGLMLGQNPSTGVHDVDRDVSWKKLVPNILEDQKHIWTFPVRLGQGHDVLPTVAVLGTTAGLVVADPHVAGYFRSTNTFHDFNRIFSANWTTAMTFAVPGALLAAGVLRKDSKMENTALLAAEAVADASVVQVVFKGATGRLRPSDIPLNGNLSDSWSDRSGFDRFHSSFPSGHAVAAFAVATVVAHRYRQHRWVPYAAYGVAAAIGFSRISTSAHFPSDVFMGATLGYTIARFTVLHRE
jgi:membrane-associated phospholipid phosphatase